MIQEVILTTINRLGQPHMAPMGVHLDGDNFIIMPFRPSATLDNVLATQSAALNYCDDVRVFAGCLTGRRDWPLLPTSAILGFRLRDVLAHVELRLIRVEDDAIRPKLHCQPVYQAHHAPFQGFNRAQHAVLEAAILISRLNRLPLEKILAELDYLRIGVEKTAGPREQEAWDWLMAAIAQYQAGSNPP